MSVDVVALVRECIRWGVEPCLHSTFESAGRLLKVLPCSVPRRNQLGEPVVLRHHRGEQWTLDIGDVHRFGPLETCVTEWARLCDPANARRLPKP